LPSARSKRINVLFTSVGRRVELLRAFRQAYGELDLQGQIVAADIDALAPGLQVADRAFLVPGVSDPNYIPTLTEIARQEAIQLIFPLIDPDIPVLAEGRQALEAHGARLAAVPLPAARIAHDKWLTHEFFGELGLPTPRSWIPQHPPEVPLPFPLFVKPRVGSAGRQAVRVDRPDQLDFYLREIEQPIVQEFLDGPEVTSDVSCGLNGELWAIVSRQRIEVRWGEVAKGRTVFEDSILQGCQAIAAGLRAIGPITVQCLMRGGQPCFTEINARFGGGLPLGIAAGVPSPRWYLAQAAGLPVEPPPLGSYQVGLYLTRHDESTFLTEGEYARLESQGLEAGDHAAP
jgi:carbamoyl-phosphate synthase large subunit